jgi:hypothetical protein
MLATDAGGKSMRLSAFLSGLTVIFATAARGDDDCRSWTPSAAHSFRNAAVDTLAKRNPPSLGARRITLR